MNISKHFFFYYLFFFKTRVHFFIADIQQVLNHLVNDTDLQSRLFPPASHGPSHAHTHAQNEADPWADIPEEVVDKIRTVYALDFQLFGYDPHRITGKRHI